MLKRINRLKKRYQYQYIYKSGNYVSDKSVSLHYTTAKSNHIKVGFAVTKKIGGAIKRNLIRRRLREIIRNHLPNLKQNYNIILVAKEQIASVDFENLSRQIVNLLKKADLFKNDEKDI